MNVCREDEGIRGPETSLMPEGEDTSPGKDGQGVGASGNGSTESGYTNEGRG